MQLAEAIRLFTIRTAVDRDLDVVATNSDGSASRRRSFLLSIMGSWCAGDQVLDPGRNRRNTARCW